MCNLVTIIGECEWIRFLRMPSCSYLSYLISRISMLEPSFIWSNNGVAVFFSLSMLLSCSVCSILFQFNPIEFRLRLVLNWIDLKVPLDCHSIFRYLEWRHGTNISIISFNTHLCLVVHFHALFNAKLACRHWWVVFVSLLFFSLYFQMKNAFCILYSRTHFKSLLSKWKAEFID